MRLLLKVLNGLFTLVLVTVIGGSAFLAFSARNAGDNMPTIMGHKVMAVISGSMEPAIMTGDAIVVKPLGLEDTIQEHDIITYRSKDDASMIITHRVVGTILVNGQAAAYVTKGDANQSEDLSTVAPEQLIGKYAFRVPYFGYVSDFMRKPAGIVGLVILPGLVLICAEFVKIWRLLEEAEKAKVAAAGGDSTQES